MNVIVLGADTFQLGLVMYLKTNGYIVHLVSNRENDPAVSLADYFHPFSYLEIDRIENIILNFDVIQIFSVASEIGLKVENEIQSKYFHTCFSLKYINEFQDKYTYKEKLWKLLPNNIPECSKSKSKALFFERHPVCVYKPRFGSGSANVRIVRSEQQSSES